MSRAYSAAELDGHHTRVLLDSALGQWEWQSSIQATSPHQFCPDFGPEMLAAWQALLLEDDGAAPAAPGRSGFWPQSGDEVAEFEMIREVGRGAFTRVYLARQLDVSRRLVLAKVIPGEMSKAPSVAASREVNLAVRDQSDDVLTTSSAGPWHVTSVRVEGTVSLGDVVDRCFVDANAPPLSGLQFQRGAAPEPLANAAPEGAAPANAAPANIAWANIAWARREPAAWARNWNAGGANAASEESYVRVAVRFIAEVAASVQKAHAAGIRIGDLRPTQILVGHDGRPRLLDYTMFAASGDRMISRSVLSYSAPERIRAVYLADAADRAGHPADVFSLGVILFEALTGKPPYGAAQGETLRETAQRQLELQGRRLPRRRWHPQADFALQRLVGRCLAPNPAARPTAIEVERQLQAWLARRLPQRDAKSTSRRQFLERAVTVAAAGGLATTLEFSDKRQAPPHRGDVEVKSHLCEMYRAGKLSPSDTALALKDLYGASGDAEALECGAYILAADLGRGASPLAQEWLYELYSKAPETVSPPSLNNLAILMTKDSVLRNKAANLLRNAVEGDPYLMEARLNNGYLFGFRRLGIEMLHGSPSPLTPQEAINDLDMALQSLDLSSSQLLRAADAYAAADALERAQQTVFEASRHADFEPEDLGFYWNLRTAFKGAEWFLKMRSQGTGRRPRRQLTDAFATPDPLRRFLI